MIWRVYYKETMWWNDYMIKKVVNISIISWEKLNDEEIIW